MQLQPIVLARAFLPCDWPDTAKRTSKTVGSARSGTPHQLLWVSGVDVGAIRVANRQAVLCNAVHTNNHGRLQMQPPHKPNLSHSAAQIHMTITQDVSHKMVTLDDFTVCESQDDRTKLSPRMPYCSTEARDRILQTVNLRQTAGNFTCLSMSPKRDQAPWQ